MKLDEADKDGTLLPSSLFTNLKFSGESTAPLDCASAVNPKCWLVACCSECSQPTGALQAPACRHGWIWPLMQFLFQLDLKLNSETGGDLSTFIPNGEWEVIGNYLKLIILMAKTERNQDSAPDTAPAAVLRKSLERN